MSRADNRGDAGRALLSFALAGGTEETMSGHHQYLKIFVLAGVFICAAAPALTRVELQNQIEDLAPDTAVDYLDTLRQEVRNWPPGEQLAYYRVLSESQHKALVENRSNLDWLLFFLLGAATAALIAFSRKPRKRHLSIARTESLTTLYDHGTIFDIGKSLFIWTRREGGNLSTLVFELDELDQIKKHHGAAAADQMLQLAALNARHVLRGNDCIGRMGQEEFLVILPSTGIRQALKVAQRIHSRLEQHPLTLHDSPVLVTINVGIADNQGTDDSFKLMARRAESARKDARKRGRNQVVVAD